VRGLLLVLLFSCGSGEKANSDGGSTGEPPGDAGADTPTCTIDGDCAPGEACLGALPGALASGRCAARRDPGIGLECIAP